MTTGTLLVARSRAAVFYELPVAGTDALAAAAGNFEANRIALEAAHPAAAVSLPDDLPEMEWLYARDGALSARHCDRRWFGDVSVPRRAAERMLAKLDVAGGTAVMLAPTHAQQVRVALSRLNARQALIAILPGEHDAGVIFSCESFAPEIRAGRLWPVIGPDWRRQLDELLSDQAGLAPAASMVRVPGVNDAIVERLLRPCEAILTKHAQSHRQHLSLLGSRPVPATPRVRRVGVVVAGWRLWGDESSLLRDAMRRATVDCVTIDIARPDQSSALSIARRAEGCDAIVTANVGRADLPSVVPTAVPWVTLATTERLPAVGGPRDRLVVADAAQRARAIAAGWPAARIDDLAFTAPRRLPRGERIALVYDLPPIEKPAPIEEMSSHAIVWDRVVRLLADGATPTMSPGAWIVACGEALCVDVGQLPVDVIRERALVPAFARALALRLRKANVHFDLYGSGWQDVPDLRDVWRGPIDSEATFDAMIERASAIVDVWPGTATHAARRAGRPMVAAWARADAQLVAAARLATSVTNVATLDLDAILARV